MPSTISRRGLLAGIGGLGATAGAGLLGPDAFRPPQRLSAAVAADTWPRRKHDPARTGHQPERGPRDPPSEAWRTEVGGALTGPGLVVTDDSVLTVARTATVALDPGDGSRRWRHDYRERRLLGEGEPESVQVGPVAADGRVLTAGDVTLYTHDDADGATGWGYRTNSSFSTVLAVGNTVFLTSLIGDADRLVALSLETGLPYWRRETVAVPVAFAPDAGYLLTVREPAAADGGALQARDPASGAVEWGVGQPDRPAAGNSFAVADGRVYAARGPVVALDPETGEEVWRYADGPGDLSAPVTDGGRVYAFGDGTVALDAETGAEVWRAAAEVTGFGSPAIAGDRLYVPTDGAVLALDTADGSRAFEASLPGSPAALAVAGGRLVVRTERSVVALEGET